MTDKNVNIDWTTTYGNLEEDSKRIVNTYVKLKEEAQEAGAVVEESADTIEGSNKKIGDSAETAADDVEKGNAKIKNSFADLKNFLKNAAIFAGVTLGVREFFNVTGEFEERINNIGTLLGGNKEEADALGESIQELSKRFPKDPNEIGAAAYDVVSAGIEGVANQTKVLESSLNLAVAGLGSTEQAVDLTTSALNAFKLEAEDSEQVAQVLFKAVKNGKTTVDDLSQGFGGVAGTVAQAGISFDDFIATVSAATTVGQPASQVYTQLKAVIAGLTRDTDESAELWERLGVESFPQLIEQAGGLGEALKVLREEYDGNDAGLLKLVGSTEALNAINTVGVAVYDSYVDTLGDMRSATDDLSTAVETQREGFNATVQELRNNVTVLLIRLANVILPAVSAAIRGLVEFINSSNPAFQAIKAFLVVLTGGAIVSALTGIGAAAGVAAGGFATLTASLAPLVALITGPIGIIAGVAALGVGVYNLVDSFLTLDGQLERSEKKLEEQKQKIEELSQAADDAAERRKAKEEELTEFIGEEAAKRVQQAVLESEGQKDLLEELVKEAQKTQKQETGNKAIESKARLDISAAEAEAIISMEKKLRDETNKARAESVKSAIQQISILQAQISKLSDSRLQAVNDRVDRLRKLAESGESGALSKFFGTDIESQLDRALEEQEQILSDRNEANEKLEAALLSGAESLADISDKELKNLFDTVGQESLEVLNVRLGEVQAKRREDAEAAAQAEKDRQAELDKSKNKIDKLGGSTSGAAEKTKEADEAAKEYAGSLDQIEQKTDELLMAQEELNQKVKDSEISNEEFKQESKKLEDQLKDLAEISETVYGELPENLDDAVNAEKRLREETKKLKEEEKEREKIIKDTAKEIEDSFDTYEKGIKKVEKGLDNVAKKQEDFSNDLKKQAAEVANEIETTQGNTQQRLTEIAIESRQKIAELRGKLAEEDDSDRRAEIQGEINELIGEEGSAIEILIDRLGQANAERALAEGQRQSELTDAQKIADEEAKQLATLEERQKILEAIRNNEEVNVEEIADFENRQLAESLISRQEALDQEKQDLETQRQEIEDIYIESINNIDQAVFESVERQKDKYDELIQKVRDAVQLIQSAGGGDVTVSTNGGSGFNTFHDGGPVPAPARKGYTVVADKLKSMESFAKLEAGEYVINKDSTRRNYGVLQAINSGSDFKDIAGKYLGGMSKAARVSNSSTSSRQSINIENVSIKQSDDSRAASDLFSEEFWMNSRNNQF